MPKRHVHAPHEWLALIYGKHCQYAKDPDTLSLLDKKETTFVQQVVGSLLYYSRAISHPILVALNEIAVHQQHPTQKTK